MRRISPRSLLLLVPLVLVAGCTAYKPPVFRVGEARVSDASDEAVRLDVDLELENPNAEELSLIEFDYRFSLDGRVVFEGRRSAQATLGPRSRRPMVLPAVVPAAEIAGAATGAATATGAERTWSIEGELVYLTPGALAEILLDTGVRKPTVAFSGHGRLAAAE